MRFQMLKMNQNLHANTEGFFTDSHTCVCVCACVCLCVFVYLCVCSAESHIFISYSTSVSVDILYNYSYIYVQMLLGLLSILHRHHIQSLLVKGYCYIA